MTISEDACEDCGYAYKGCGGLGLLMSGGGFQTVSCAACQTLHDVELGINLRETLSEKQPRKRGPGRRSAPEESSSTRESALTALAFACPVDASHTVRPWTQEASGWVVPGGRRRLPALRRPRGGRAGGDGAGLIPGPEKTRLTRGQRSQR